MNELDQLRSGKLHYLKRRVNSENTSLRNHLLSIVHDSEFVLHLKEFLSRLVLFANLRNGKWYSDAFDGHCYFKSTDGHESSWSFSLSRMNLELARVAATSRGAIIVDSTRQGKKFPDSMTATIPIWCSVINEVVFGMSFPLDPPPWMSHSAVCQINALLPQMVSSVGPPLRNMIQALLKPLLLKPFKPLWVTPDEDRVMEWSGEHSDEFLDSVCSESSNPYTSTRPGDCTPLGVGGTPNPKILGFTPLVLLSCSPVRSDAAHSAHHSWKYVQGAGDDEENWCAGLSSEVFWKERDHILASNDHHEVDAAVALLLKTSPGQRHAPNTVPDSGSSGDRTSRDIGPSPDTPHNDPDPTPALFCVGLSGVVIGVRSMLPENDLGVCADAEMEGKKNRRLIGGMERGGVCGSVRGVIVFQHATGSSSGSSTSSSRSSSSSSSSGSSSSSKSNRASLASDTVREGVFDRGRGEDGGRDKDPLAPIPVPVPPPQDIPCLFLRAGSSKKESSGQSRSLWCEEILPACMAFYRKYCIPVDRRPHSSVITADWGDGNGSEGVEDVVIGCSRGVGEEGDAYNDGEKTDVAVGRNVVDGGGERRFPPNSGSLLIVCEDGMLSCTVALSLLLAHFQTTIEFDTPSSPPPPHPSLSSASTHARPNPPPSPLSSLVPLSTAHAPVTVIAAPSLTSITIPASLPSISTPIPSLSTPIPSLSTPIPSLSTPIPSLYILAPRSKDDIKACLTVLQMHLPFAHQLPRRLVKELNMFFCKLKHKK